MGILLPCQIALMELKGTDSIRRTRRSQHGPSRSSCQKVEPRRGMFRRTNSRRSHLQKREQVSRSDSFIAASSSPLLSRYSDHLPKKTLLDDFQASAAIHRRLSVTMSLRSESNHSTAGSCTNKSADADAGRFQLEDDSCSSIFSSSSDLQVEEFASDELDELPPGKAQEPPPRRRSSNREKHAKMRSREPPLNARSQMRRGSSHRRRSSSSRSLVKYHRFAPVDNLLKSPDDSVSSLMSLASDDLTCYSTSDEPSQTPSPNSFDGCSLSEALGRLEGPPKLDRSKGYDTRRY